ncbi:hypothetical protein CCH79_00019899, partial [Gambusia affinis]
MKPVRSSWKKSHCLSCVVTMSSVQHLRDFIRERLTAAAQEIFTEVEKTIICYEEELDAQRRMMGINWKPEIKLHRIGSELQRQSSDLKPHVSIEEEASVIHHVCNQGKSSSEDQEEGRTQWREEQGSPLTEEQTEPGSPRIKEEEEDMQLVLVEQRDLNTEWMKEEEEEPEPPLIEENEESRISWAKEECIAPETTLTENQVEVGPPWIKDREMEPEASVTKESQESEFSRTKEKRVIIEPPLSEGRQEPETQWIKEEEETESPLTEDLDFLLLKHEQQEPEYLPLRQEQKDLCSSQDGEQLVQKQSTALIETSTLQKSDFTEQLFCHISTVDETKDQEEINSSVSQSQSHSGSKNMSFKCDICGAFFNKKCNFEKHCQTHTGERPFQCETCGKGFSQMGSLKEHKNSHTGERTFSCDTCGKSFSRSGYLKIHQKLHTSEKPFSCEACGKSFVRMGYLKAHKKSHTGERPFFCEICGKGLSRMDHLSHHMKTHTGERPFSCDTCGKNFSRIDNLNHHKKIHTAEPDRTSICQTFSSLFCLSVTAEVSRDELEVTMSSVQHLRDFIRERLTAAAEEIFTEVEKTIICYEEELDAQRRMMGINWKPEIKLHRIGSELQRQNVLKQHVWKDEKEPMQNVQQDFEGASSLDQEEPEASQIKNEPEELCSRQDGEQLEPVNLLETPSGQDRDFHEVDPNTKEFCHHYSSLTCDVCGKTFKSKYNSQVHHRMHLGLKPFVCTVCGKGFSQKIHLKGHISIHTGEWPFYCKICGRGCVDRRRLNNHMNTHSKEKSFTCEICGIGFTLLSSLNSHLRKHNRERLFSCPTCGKIFTRKVSLKAHKWVHTGEKPFSCTVCGIKFRTANGMYSHKRSHKDQETNLVKHSEHKKVESTNSKITSDLK